MAIITRPPTEQEAEWYKQNGYDPSKIQLQVDDTHPAQSGAGGAALRGAASSVIPTVAGGLGAGAATGALEGSAAGPIGTLAGGLLGAVAAGYAASKVQEAVMPDIWRQQLADDATKHPVASTVGSLATLPLGGFRPSWDETKLAATGLADIATGKAGVFTGGTMQGTQAAVNAVAGAGVGAAQEVANEEMNGQDLSAGRILGNAAIGATFNKVNRLGRAYGFHPTVQDPLTQNYNALSPRTADQTTVPATSDVTADKLIGTYIPDATSSPTGVPVNTGSVYKKRVPYLESTDTHPQEINTLEGEGGPVQMEGQDPAELRRQQDFQKALSEKQIQDQKDRDDAIKQAEQQREVQPSLQGLQLGTQVARPEVQQGGAIISPLSKIEASNLRESPSELEARNQERKLEGNPPDKYSQQGETISAPTRPKTEAYNDAMDAIEKAKITTAQTQPLFDAWKARLRAAKGLNVSAGDIESKGQYHPDTGVTTGAKATQDTIPHEAAHDVWTRLPDEFKQSYASKVKPNVDKYNADVDKWNAANPAESMRHIDAEEYFASEVGMKTVSRLSKGEGTGFKNWLKDFSAKMRMKDGSASLDDIHRRAIIEVMDGRAGKTPLPTIKSTDELKSEEGETLHNKGANAEYFQRIKPQIEKPVGEREVTPEKASEGFKALREAIAKSQEGEEGLTDRQKYKREKYLQNREKMLAQQKAADAKAQAERDALGEARSAGVKPTTYPHDKEYTPPANAPARRVPFTIGETDEPKVRKLESDIRDAIGHNVQNIKAKAGNDFSFIKKEDADEIVSTVKADILRDGLDRAKPGETLDKGHPELSDYDRTIMRRTRDAVDAFLKQKRESVGTTSLDAAVGEGTETRGDKIAGESQGSGHTVGDLLDEYGEIDNPKLEPLLSHLETLPRDKEFTEQELKALQEKFFGGTKKQEESEGIKSKDRLEYEQAQEDMRKHEFGSDEFMKAWKRNEEIKNRNGGMPPKKQGQYEGLNEAETPELKGEQFNLLKENIEDEKPYSPELESLNKFLEQDKYGYRRFGKNQGEKEGLEAPAKSQVSFLMAKPELDVARDATGEEGKKAADAIEKFRVDQREFRAKFSERSLAAANKASETDNTKVWNTVQREYREGKFHRDELTNDKQRALYDAIRADWRSKQDTQIQNKFTIRDNGKQREAKINPHFVPGIMKAETVQQIAEHGPEYGKIKKTFLDYYKKEGYDEKEAEAKWKAIAGIGSAAQPNHVKFAGARLAEGAGVPPEYMEPNLKKVVAKYANRVATDFAWRKNVEMKPEVAEKLNPANEERLHQFDHIVEKIKGEPFDKNENLVKAINRVATSSILGPMTNVHILWSSMFNPMQYLKASELAGAYAGAFKNLSTSAEHAFKTGYAQHDTSSVKDILDKSSNTVQKLNAISNIVGKVNGRQWTDKASKVFAQSLAEQIVPLRLRDAQAGDRDATRLIKQLDPEFSKDKTYTPDQLTSMASTLGGFIHGSHDERTLPAALTGDSWLKPFLSLMSWSTAQTNQWMKHVWEPARSGNLQPLLMSALGATVGGYAIQQIRQLISDKKSAIPSLTEIANSDRGLEGNIPLLAYNFMQMASFTGFAGLGSVLAKDAFDAAYKNIPQGATFPLDEVTGAVLETVHEGVSAWMQTPTSEAFFNIFPRMMADIARENVQSARIAMNWAADKGLSSENEQYKYEVSSQEGNLRRYRMAEGQPYDQQVAPNNNPYLNIPQKEFKRTSDLGEAVSELPGLVEMARKRAQGNPEIFQQQLQSLKQNSFQTMPSLETGPLQFSRYYNYLVATQGKERADEMTQNYVRRNTLNQIKSSFVP